MPRANMTAHYEQMRELSRPADSEQEDDEDDLAPLEATPASPSASPPPSKRRRQHIAMDTSDEDEAPTPNSQACTPPEAELDPHA